VAWRQGQPVTTHGADLAAAQAPRSCPACGRLFIGSAAFTVHQDGARCLPDHTIESLLVLRDGAWITRGSDTSL
jgi:hypothetical protein